MALASRNKLQVHPAHLATPLITSSMECQCDFRSLLPSRVLVSCVFAFFDEEIMGVLFGDSLHASRQGAHSQQCGLAASK